jgi:hypothetical protein
MLYGTSRLRSIALVVGVRWLVCAFRRMLASISRTSSSRAAVCRNI